MKNKYFSFVALAAAALATSCASDDLAEQKQEQNQNGTRTVTLTASVNDVQTRVGMTKDGTTAKFYWHKNDQILVQTKDGESYTGTAFSITGDNAKDGDTKATFTGEVTGTIGGYAVYPYSTSHAFTETTLTYNLPASYTDYTPATKIFGTEGDYPSKPTNMPMLGKIADGKISFKCLGGLAVIRVDKMPAESGTLKVTADQQLSGDFTVSDLSATDAQIATPTTTATSNNTVTFNFSGASSGNVGVFYLPLPTGGYSNVKIDVTYGGTTQTINYGNLYVARKSVASIPLYATGTNGALTKFSKIDGNVYTLNGHKFVDLGLDVLWATMNVGADTETDYGSYFAWGEISPKENYALSTYKYGTSENDLTKYNTNDSKTTLEPADDAATANWGISCRMPTKDEFYELADNCTWTSETINEISGYKGTSNSNSIFLPPAGYYDEDGDNVVGSTLYYWTNTRSSSQDSGRSYTVDNDEGTLSLSTHSHYRYRGLPVRAVTTKK